MRSLLELPACAADTLLLFTAAPVAIPGDPGGSAWGLVSATMTHEPIVSVEGVEVGADLAVVSYHQYSGSLEVEDGGELVDDLHEILLVGHDLAEILVGVGVLVEERLGLVVPGDA